MLAFRSGTDRVVDVAIAPGRRRHSPPTPRTGPRRLDRSAGSAVCRLDRDQERTARRGLEEGRDEDRRRSGPVDRRVDMTVPGIDEGLPAVYVCSAQSSAPIYVSAPETTFTTTGPRCVCQGNCAPGCTVYRTTTVCDGSSVLTTVVSDPSCAILIFRPMSSTKTARPVSGSPRIGGGGSSASAGRTLTPMIDRRRRPPRGWLACFALVPPFLPAIRALLWLLAAPRGLDGNRPRPVVSDQLRQRTMGRRGRRSLRKVMGFRWETFGVSPGGRRPGARLRIGHAMIRFGPYRLDPVQGLKRGKREVRLTPQIPGRPRAARRPAGTRRQQGGAVRDRVARHRGHGLGARHVHPGDPPGARGRSARPAVHRDAAPSWLPLRCPDDG